MSYFASTASRCSPSVWTARCGNGILPAEKEIRRLTELPGWYANALALSADGKTLAVVAGAGNGAEAVAHVRLLDSVTLQERFRAVVPEALPYAVALSPDGRFVSAGFSLARAKEGHLRLWDSWTMKQMAPRSGGEQKVNCVRFLAGGKTVAFAGDDAMVHLLNVADGLEQVFATQSIGPVPILAFSPAGDMLASGGADGNVRLWDTNKGVLQHTLRQHALPIDGLVFSPDGELVLATCQAHQGIGPTCPGCLWNARTGQYLREFQPLLGCAAFAPDGKTLAAADDSNGVCLWDVARGAKLRRFVGHGGLVHAVAFSPDGSLLASADDYAVRLWRVATGGCLKTLAVDILTPLRLWFSPDGSLLFVCPRHYSHNLTPKSDRIEVFETSTGECAAAFTASTTTLQGTWLAHGGSTLVVCSAPKKFRAIDLATGNALGADLEYGDDFTAVEFSRDGRMLALGNEDGRLVLWKPPPLPSRKPLPAEMDETKLKNLWQALTGADAKLAYQARWLLSSDPKQTLPLLPQHCTR